MNLLTDQLAAHYAKVEKADAWADEFQKINVRSSYTDSQSSSLAVKIENRRKNRYVNIVPFDNTIVKLKNGNYINASFVSVNSRKDRRYILCQGPLESTIEDFWRMVYEQKCSLIVMLNKFIEKSQCKCADYLPRKPGQPLKYPSLEVTVVSEIYHHSYMQRDIEVVGPDKSNPLSVRHVHYVLWPDFGVPESVDNFLHMLGTLQNDGLISDPNRPPVIHCSAGVGRSGSFVLVDLAVSQLVAEKNPMVEVEQIVCEIRTCRMGLIQTSMQYKFCYQAIVRVCGILAEFGPDAWMNELKVEGKQPESSVYRLPTSISASSSSCSTCSSLSLSSEEDFANMAEETSLVRHRKRPREQIPAMDSDRSDEASNISLQHQIHQQSIKESRLARREKTLKHIASIQDKLQSMEKQNMRRRLPNWLRRPLSRLFVSSGYIQNAKQAKSAVLWTGVSSLIVLAVAWGTLYFR